MTFKRNYPLILIFSIVFFVVLSSCGSNSSAILPSADTSSEFQEWLNSLPPTPKEFVTYWKETEVKNGWRYVDWDELSWEEHRFDTPEEIWKSRLINCHRMTNLLLEKYDGEYLLIEQEGFDHAVFKGEDKEGIFYISFCGLKAKFTRSFEEIFTDY